MHETCLDVVAQAKAVSRMGSVKNMFLKISQNL